MLRIMSTFAVFLAFRASYLTRIRQLNRTPYVYNSTTTHATDLSFELIASNPKNGPRLYTVADVFFYFILFYFILFYYYYYYFIVYIQKYFRHYKTWILTILV